MSLQAEGGQLLRHWLPPKCDQLLAWCALGSKVPDAAELGSLVCLGGWVGRKVCGWCALTQQQQQQWSAAKTVAMPLGAPITLWAVADAPCLAVRSLRPELTLTRRTGRCGGRSSATCWTTPPAPSVPHSARGRRCAGGVCSSPPPNHASPRGSTDGFPPVLSHRHTGLPPTLSDKTERPVLGSVSAWHVCECIASHRPRR